MARTVISLADADKRWLDQQAKIERVPMTELIRRAVHAFREQRRRAGGSLDALLERTSGTWRQGDGLEWQRSLRDEWE